MRPSASPNRAYLRGIDPTINGPRGRRQGMLAVAVLFAMGVGGRGRPGGAELRRWKPTSPLRGTRSGPRRAQIGHIRGASTPP